MFEVFLALIAIGIWLFTSFLVMSTWVYVYDEFLGGYFKYGDKLDVFVGILLGLVVTLLLAGTGGFLGLWLWVF